MELFKKSIVVGVSVTPEVGLEVAQIDFERKLVLKYASRPLEYDSVRREIVDLDLFKETLQDLLVNELAIPKNSEIVLNIPATTFSVVDYPASLDTEQVHSAIEEKLYEHYIFNNTDADISMSKLPNSSIQFNKWAYTAVQKTMLLEIAMSIKDIGYKLRAIDCDVNSVLNTLIYKERIDVDSNDGWVMLLVDTSSCRLISMQGRDFVDSYEERISIGEVLGDAENYSTVISAVQPVLNKLPAKYLCVVSKTNIISAEVLAGKLKYSAPIIHQEANSYSKEAFLNFAPDIDDSSAKQVSLDVIGAAIYKDFLPYSHCHFNLFNDQLGDIYLQEQPPRINLNGKVIELTNEFLIKLFIAIAAVFLILIIGICVPLSTTIHKTQTKLSELETQISEINKFLKDNESVSSDMFDEGVEIKVGLGHNKNIYSYYTIVGTEIPKKLWLTHLKLGDTITIEGQADNLESVYSFFRSIKDYDSESAIKLQKLGLASTQSLDAAAKDAEFDLDDAEDTLLTSLNADFYEFKISNEVVVPEAQKKDASSTDKSADGTALPDLETIKEK